MKRMKRLYNITLILLLLLFASAGASAQIRGVITDSLTHEPLMYITVQYEGKGVGGISNAEGEYQVETRKGWNELTFSAIGYITKKVKFAPGTKVLNVALAPADVMLSEVVVKPKKEKYSRKNNPAVEFMKKVIEHKKALKLEENDFYQYQKYEKMKMSINDVTPEKMEKGIYKKFSFFKDQVEVSPKTNKMILPISIKETASRTIYRKSPKSEKTIIEGMNSNGIEEFFNTGDMLGTILTNIFSDVNIYDDDIRLLQRRFVSPIGRGAINFYKFYLMDTLMVDKQECVHLTFVPQNPQDFGFTGHLYVVKDSTYAVKKAVMNLPKKTGVNFVENLDIVQQFEQLPDSNWVLTDDDMTVELALMKGIQGLEVQRTTKYSDYKFDEIEPRLFRLKGSVIKEANMLAKSDEYWAKVRQVPLTKKESSMDVFMNRIEQIPGFKYVIFGAKALIENFVETGSKKHPSKFDFGPINTMITSNYVNGTRFRLSGMTTGNLHPHWKLQRVRRLRHARQEVVLLRTGCLLLQQARVRPLGISQALPRLPVHLRCDVSYGQVSGYGQGQYVRRLEMDYRRPDVVHARRHPDLRAGNQYRLLRQGHGAPPQRPARRHAAILEEQRHYPRRMEREEYPGARHHHHRTRSDPALLSRRNVCQHQATPCSRVAGRPHVHPLAHRRSERRAGRRIQLQPHGSQHPQTFLVRFVGQAGRYRPCRRAVEHRSFPLLNLPMANLSYITQNNESFNLIDNMEFLNDRYASLALSYDMNGKTFNRIPLIKKLKWREMFRIRGMWGTLTDKNNPYKSSNPDLFLFPMRDGVPTSHVMGKTPYIEASVGIYNILKLLHIEYVRRLTYTDIPGVKKGGVRFMILMIF